MYVLCGDLLCADADLSAVLGADCNYRPSDKIRRRVAQRAFLKALYSCALDKPNVKKPSSHASVYIKLNHTGGISDFHIVHCVHKIRPFFYLDCSDNNICRNMQEC